MDNKEKQPVKRSTLKNATRNELIQLNKDELVDKIIQLEAHNTQLKNIINKNTLSETPETDKTRKKPFDFTKCHFRRILLHIMYFGWDYQGLAVQEGFSNTIEHELFHALIKSCLIENRETANYHRCGRTDKGVSSFGQVISITLRSKFPQDEQNKVENVDKEIEYCKILNRLLSENIRVLSWLPIPSDKPDFSARFDCKKRLYKYYFPLGGLDILAMKDACKYLIGSHDFRNLCKMDVGNGVTTFIREIFSAEILPVGETTAAATSMYYFKIEGNAFLWHQIRCIFGVLMLIGQRKELPEIVKDLLDIENCPRKPQYNMALDIPLNLYHCHYDVKDDWMWDLKELVMTIKHLQSLWTLSNVKSTMIKDCIDSLEETYKSKLKARQIDEHCDESERDIRFHAECLVPGVKPKIYQPLLKRPTCSSLEERIEYYRKKRKTEEKLRDVECTDVLSCNS